jgi:hypothetical protein
MKNRKIKDLIVVNSTKLEIENADYWKTGYGQLEFQSYQKIRQEWLETLWFCSSIGKEFE